ncbi:MAG: helix-turn-helix domain-containing protein [Syntrophorhabdales bacterium]|jgi:predicted site-specific integrase-resolvase
MDTTELIPLKEVRAMLKVSKVTLWTWVKQGKLSTVKLSPRKVYVEKAELERFIKESRK